MWICIRSWSKLFVYCTGLLVNAQEKYFDELEIDHSFYGSSIPEKDLHVTRAFTQEFGDDETGNPNFKKFKLCCAPLYMTIEDVLKWIEFIRSKYSKHGYSPEQFFKPTTFNRLGPLGILRHQDGQVSVHLHGAKAYSYGCSTYRNYVTGLAVILMTNKHEGIDLQDISEGILEILKANGMD